MTDFEGSQAPTHVDHIDVSLQAEDYRVMFEEAWRENERLRHALILRETVLRRLLAEAHQLREVVGHVTAVAEELSRQHAENGETEPLLVDSSASGHSGVSQEPGFG